MVKLELFSDWCNFLEMTKLNMPEYFLALTKYIIIECPSFVVKGEIASITHNLPLFCK